jgi:hypothetical protein
MINSVDTLSKMSLGTFKLTRDYITKYIKSEKNIEKDDIQQNMFFKYTKLFKEKNENLFDYFRNFDWTRNDQDIINDITYKNDIPLKKNELYDMFVKSIEHNKTYVTKSILVSYKYKKLKDSFVIEAAKRNDLKIFTFLTKETFEYNSDNIVLNVSPILFKGATLINAIEHNSIDIVKDIMLRKDIFKSMQNGVLNKIVKLNIDNNDSVEFLFCKGKEFDKLSQAEKNILIDNLNDMNIGVQRNIMFNGAYANIKEHMLINLVDSGKLSGIDDTNNILSFAVSKNYNTFISTVMQNIVKEPDVYKKANLTNVLSHSVTTRNIDAVKSILETNKFNLDELILKQAVSSGSKEIFFMVLDHIKENSIQIDDFSSKTISAFSYMNRYSHNDNIEIIEKLKEFDDFNFSAMNNQLIHLFHSTDKKDVVEMLLKDRNVVKVSIDKKQIYHKYDEMKDAMKALIDEKSKEKDESKLYRININLNSIMNMMSEYYKENQTNENMPAK